MRIRVGPIAFVAAVVAVMLIAACDNPGGAQREAEAAKKQRESAERYKAEREVEAALFADPKTAEETINRRIDDWVTRSGGLLLIKGEWSTSRQPTRTIVEWHAMPNTVGWYVSCGSGELNVTLGTWLTASGTVGDRFATDNVFNLTVASTPLSDEQCQRLVVGAGKKMLAITAMAEKP